MSVQAGSTSVAAEKLIQSSFFIAQNNLQLLTQLRQEGYSNDDIKKIVAAYQLAMRLFTGHFRGNGKSFIAHLIGTASMLVSIREPVEVVAAGLLHAAYIWGNFGTGKYGRDAAKREQVRAIAGLEVEDLISGYDDLAWSPKAIATLAQAPDQFNERDRHLVLMRLANELEDHLDLGVLYCNNFEQRLEYLRQSRDNMIRLAEALGYPVLASHLAQVFEDCLTTQVDPELRAEKDISYLLPPLSHQRRWTLLAKAALARLRRLVKR